MVSNYYILSAVMREFIAQCSGAFLSAAYSLNRDELCLEFDNGITLVILARSGHPVLYFKEQRSGLPKKNVIKFFPDIVGEKLLGLEASKNDKLFTLQFTGGTLEIRLFNNPNVILKKDKEISGFKKERRAKDSLGSKSEIQTSLVHQKLPMLGKILEREFSFLYKNADSYAALVKNCEEFDAILREQEKAYLYTLKSDKLLLSPVALTHITDKKDAREFKSINEAVRTTIFQRDEQERFLKQRSSLEKTLLAFMSEQEKAITQAESSLSDSSRADRFQAIGDALMTESYQIPKGTAEWRSNILGKEEVIALDPAQTVFQIADKFYAKARYSRNSKKDLLVKIAKMRENASLAGGVLDEIRSIASARELVQKKKQLESSPLGRILNEKDRSNGNTDAPSFREFIVSGGYKVFVGKNAKQNDRLTFGFARKDDLWLHARHVSGSHVIIRTESRNDTVPKETIEAAAAIAAFFSDAKTQTFAPVAFTRRKYVRKPRGAMPGAVILEREEVVIVAPKNPGEDTNG